MEKVLQNWAVEQEIFFLPEEVGALERGGHKLDAETTADVENISKGVVSCVFRPVLVSLPLVLLHQLRDHHNHRHLEKKNEGQRMSIVNHLFLDDHVPEVVERLRLGSLGCQELLLAGAEDDSACIDEAHL